MVYQAKPPEAVARSPTHGENSHNAKLTSPLVDVVGEEKKAEAVEGSHTPSVGSAKIPGDERDDSSPATAPPSSDVTILFEEEAKEETLRSTLESSRGDTKAEDAQVDATLNKIEREINKLEPEINPPESETVLTAKDASTKPEESAATGTISARINTEDIPATASEAPVVTAGLQHSFAPGDHVIRWEMLPIVWPIQIHGIVLEVNQFCVTIADFGLTAELRHEEKKADKIRKKAAAEASDLRQETKKHNKQLQEFWERVKPPDNTKKDRITVHIITSQEEIKPWKKIHYGRGFFGMGNENEEGEAGLSKPKGAVMKQKLGNWFKRVNQNIQQRRWHKQQEGTNSKKPAAAATVTASSAAVAAAAETGVNGRLHQSTDAPAIHRPNCLKGEFKAYHPNDANNNGGTDDSKNGRESSVVDPPISGNSTHSTLSNLSTETDPAAPTSTKEKPKLPESDPPKLVLARTQLLLERGEAILPPYHPFKSNSECIAVFCKTGYWRTLQASIFLHSTAIGNAKSSMAMTLGVAASAHIFAPVVALAGAVAVGAPYVILQQSHKRWQETTLRLTDAFWAQAPNEVFVECIEHWSNLNPDENIKDKNIKDETNNTDTAAAKTEEPTQRYVSV